MSFQMVFLLLTISSMAKPYTIIEAEPISDVDEKFTLECHKRIYTYRVSNMDQNGKECWDILSVQACWGRCDSSEIPGFQFPFKTSIHPVCIHYGRNRAFVILRNCEEGALPSTARYEYYEAADCKCQQCSALDTMCDGQRFSSRRSSTNPGAFKRIARGRTDYFY